MPLGAPLDHVSELDLRISASEVTAGSLSISNAAATAILDEQQLVVTIGEAEIDGGSAEARLTLETVDGALSGTTDIELADVALGDLLEAIPLPPAISGSTTVTLHATGAGRTLGEFAEALTGEAQIAIADGVLDGVDLTALPAILSDPDADAMEGSTAFAAAACTVAIADGQMTTEALEAEGDGFSVHMNGSVGLLEPTIAGRGVVSLAESDAAPEEVPFLIDGTWQHLRLLPDLGPPVERTDIAPEPGDPAPVSSEEPAN
jgi:AsmA protein